MKIQERIERLKKEMQRHHIDAYVVPTCDFHGSEYIGDYFKTREYISGFTGSAGTVIVTAEETSLWTDGRYFLQAGQQLAGTGIGLMKMGEEGVPTTTQYLKETLQPGSTIGFDGRCMTVRDAEELAEIPSMQIRSDVDLVGDIWEQRPALSCKPIWQLPQKYAGISAVDKIAQMREEMAAQHADVLVLTALDEVAWTLNLRGDDIRYTPVFLAYLVLTQRECTLFVQQKAISQELREILQRDGITMRDYEDVYAYIESLKECTIWLDKESANYNIVKAIRSDNQIVKRLTPALQQKAVKNETEIENIRRAHLLDGIAMTKFLYWLKTNVGKVPMSEVSLGAQLEVFRGQAKSYLGPSFAPIVGYQEHGAIVHYSATVESDVAMHPEGVVLIDSGGQYLEGTTDITRTISLGSVTEKMREMYTAVLRGHLNLAAATFKEGCTGISLDYLARKTLWEKGLDYNHGTGHGVGYLLNVHEAPNAFRYRVMDNPQLNPAIVPGMVTSDEPGVYLENEFGVRIENLIVCVEKEQNTFGKFLQFEPLTLVPYDKALIRREDMTEQELQILSGYHEMVYEKLAPYLTQEEKVWLRTEIE